MLSGVGPRKELERAGVTCILDSPHVGKHLKDHVQVPLLFHSAACGLPVAEVAISMGADALRQPRGPLPANPEEDETLPVELAALRKEAERRLAEWATTGCGVAASSLYDAAAWFSTGLGDTHSHDAQIACIPCGFTLDLWKDIIHMDMDKYVDNPGERLSADARNVLLFANPVLPHSEGEIVLESDDPFVHPAIRMNYYSDPHDMKVMVAVLLRTLEIAAHWPKQRIGRWLVPPQLAAKHNYQEGASPSTGLLEDIALHFSITVYHLTSTCRIGSVVDPQLRVKGTRNLRVADASVMPNVVSGNTNAACVMIGEKAAEMVAADHGLQLAQFVGSVRERSTPAAV
jgi:choline dehydrogenase-like flavoprotein